MPLIDFFDSTRGPSESLSLFCDDIVTVRFLGLAPAVSLEPLLHPCIKSGSGSGPGDGSNSDVGGDAGKASAAGGDSGSFVDLMRSKSIESPWIVGDAHLPTAAADALAGLDTAEEEDEAAAAAAARSGRKRCICDGFQGRVESQSGIFIGTKQLPARGASPGKATEVGPVRSTASKCTKVGNFVSQAMSDVVTTAGGVKLLPPLLSRHAKSLSASARLKPRRRHIVLNSVTSI
mmetsp:Transcript_17824/g.45120  ORF Transcript_17824/g.45120 Transcript_17824/m.45120 type:complete len:234 (+) Transcript_17824:202-903(+)